ncbi:MAG: hypothetical protein WKF96_02055 [Solirubrobacteraceae bacterium]
MMVLFIAAAIAGAIFTQGTSLFAVAVVNVLLSLWANGVMSNFKSDPQACPNSASTVSMLTTVAAVIFIIVGLASY